MSFRIAIGNCSCRKKSNGINYKICQEIDKTLKIFKQNTKGDIDKFLFKTRESDNVPGIYISTYLKELSGTRKLVVVQAQLRTLFLPNFISFNFIGKLFSEGIVIKNDGEWKYADDKLMWEFR